MDVQVCIYAINMHVYKNLVHDHLCFADAIVCTDLYENFVAYYYLMSLSFKFHRDPSFCCGYVFARSQRCIITNYYKFYQCNFLLCLKKNKGVPLRGFQSQLGWVFCFFSLTKIALSFEIVGVLGPNRAYQINEPLKTLSLLSFYSSLS